jgi:hypothetical protein
MDFTISCVTWPATESPMNASAPIIASASVRRFVFTAKGALNSFIASLRPRRSRPSSRT